MKYYELKEIVKYLEENAKTIKRIKRLDNNLLSLEFNDKNILYFDMTKGNALIYKKEGHVNSKREFNAPFDVVLQKRFMNVKITNIYLVNDDKVLRFDVVSQSSYKALKCSMQFEFTGKNTNCIIIDENEIVLEALRHIDEFASSRIVKVGQKLEAVPQPNFDFKHQDIADVEAFLYANYEQKEAQLLQQLKKQKVQQLSKHLSKIKKLLASLSSEESLYAEANTLYEKANLILSNLHNIKAYETKVVLTDFSGNDVEVVLDTNYPTPSSYANHLFSKAKKAKQRAKYIHIERDNLEQKQAFLERMIEQINASSNSDEVEFLMPKKQKNQTKTKKQELCESFFYKGYKILLGKSERENVYVLQNSKASDFWFHLKDRASCHVIVQNTKKELPEEVIEQAAKLCAQFSVDYAGNYLVDFTQRRNVKIQNGANVLYNPYQTLSVSLEK